MNTGLPADGAWSRRIPAAVISPGGAIINVQEPNVLYDAVLGWRMWAKVGYATGGSVGYYTSLNGVTWTPSASNPVLGQGGGGVSDTVSQPAIWLENGTLYLFVNIPADSPGQLPYVYTSTDGVTWTIGNGGVPYAANAAWNQWGNSCVWKEGSTYFMLQEGRTIIDPCWRTYLMTSAYPDHGWAFLNGGTALTTLQPRGDTTYNYGGPMLLTGAAIDGVYHIYFHAGPGTTTHIYHATSLDKITWTVLNNGYPIFRKTGTYPEVDQVGDADVHLLNGVWRMWFGGINNVGYDGSVELATAPANLPGLRSTGLDYT